MAKRYKDGGSWGTDTSSFANLPQDVTMKMYPKVNFGLADNVGDTLESSDAQMSADISGRNKQLKRGKM